jgi:hypothetical protein
LVSSFTLRYAQSKDYARIKARIRVVIQNADKGIKQIQTSKPLNSFSSIGHFFHRILSLPFLSFHSVSQDATRDQITN